MAEYMEGLQEALEMAQAVACRNMEAAQDLEKQYYDRSTHLQRFAEGTQVLVHGTLFPNALAAPWVRPFPITWILGPCTYEVRCGPRPTQQRVTHINHLKE